MKRAALLCTFSSFSISAVVYGSQTDAAYSSDDLTRARYATRRVCAGQCCTFLLTNPKVELAFLHTLFIWVFHPFQVIADHDS